MKNPSYALCILSFVSTLFLSSVAYADLGLSKDNFGSKAVSGKHVSGTAIKKESEVDATATDPDTPPKKDPLPEGVMCSRANSCNDHCVEVHSYVNLFTRQYQDEKVDMSVKTVGGFIKVQRIHANGKWQFEHEYNRLDLSEIETGVIHKSQLTYRMDADNLFHYKKSFTIKKEGDRFRWENKSGDYILYSERGIIVETGNRIGILSLYIYEEGEEGKLIGIQDRYSVPIYHFNYNDDGKIAKARDEHGREVTYSWSEDDLLTVVDVLGRVSRYTYNSDNQLITKSDEAGRKFYISYHKDGAVKSVLSRKGGGHYFSFQQRPHENAWYAKVTSSMGKEREYLFNADGSTKQIWVNGYTVRKEYSANGEKTITDELGSLSTNYYDEKDNLLKREFADGSTISYQYDSHNKRTISVNELGVETRYNYNNQGLVTKIMAAYKTADQTIIRYDYDERGNRISSTVYDGDIPIVTEYVYDEQDNLIETHDALGGVSSYAYDFMGNLVKKTDAVGLTSTMAYDVDGNLLSTTAPDKQQFSFTYDAADRRISSTDSEGNTTTYSYDYQDNLIKVVDALGGVQKYNYDKDNRLTKKVDAEGKYNVFFYDEGSERLAKTIDGNNNEIEITYKGYEDCGNCPRTFSNNPVRIEFPTFTRQFQYDIRGRMTAQSDYLGRTAHTEKYSYDAGGRVIAVTDQSGKITKKEYDSLNRLTTVTDPAGGITRYHYNSLGNLVSLTDAKGQVTRFEYNQLGQKIKEIRPLGNTLKYSYDAGGRLVSRTDGKGQQTSYLYNDKTGYLDAYLLKKNEEDLTGESIRFSYDKRGRLSGYDDGTTTASYEYDILGHRTSESVDYGPFRANHSYTYYRNGLKKSYTGPDGLSHRYSYNAINKLEKIDIDGVGNISYGAYNWLQPERISIPGVERHDKYDDFLRLSERKSSTQTGNPVLDLAYQYNETNNITSRKSDETITGYSYNELQRLIEVKNESDGTTSESYAYDPVGNRLSSTDKPKYSYDDNNQLLAVGDTSYSYDINGNTLSKTTNETLTEFDYNIEGRLTQISKNGSEAKYYYDPFGRRLSKEVDGKRTWFHYADEGLVAEFDGAGVLTTSYSYEPDSTWSTRPIMMGKAGNHYFYHNDYLGAPHKLTDIHGIVLWEATYDAFGRVEVEKEVVSNNLRFPGQYFDAETGLYYNWHRFYDPNTGRYLNADPIGLAGGINLFAYVDGDPVNLVDLEGLKLRALGSSSDKQRLVDILNSMGCGQFTMNHTSGSIDGSVNDDECSPCKCLREIIDSNDDVTIGFSEEAYNYNGGTWDKHGGAWLAPEHKKENQKYYTFISKPRSWREWGGGGPEVPYHSEGAMAHELLGHACDWVRDISTQREGVAQKRANQIRKMHGWPERYR